MTDLFLKVVDMALSAGWITLAVLVVRLLLKKGPKWVNPVLWGMVAVRLLLPFPVESTFSLLPGKRLAALEGTAQNGALAPGGTPVAGDAILFPPVAGGTVGLSPAVGGTEPVSAGSALNWLTVGTMIWLAGVILMLCFALFGYGRLARRVRTAVRLEGDVWQSEFVESPFVMGFFCPRIYLPFSVRERDIPSIVAHERAHIARRDHFTKVLGFLLLSVYWFHPLLWAAWLLFCRDLESACDERVIRNMDENQRVEYSTALLACSTRQRVMGICPIAFGELSVKERVSHVLRYKKPAFWTVVTAVILCAVVAVCFLTDPVRAEENEHENDAPPAVQVTAGEKEPSPAVSSSPSAGQEAPVQGSELPVPTPSPSLPEPQPAVRPPILMEETAEEFLAATLSTLRVHEDGRVTFSLPPLFPAEEGSKCDLYINLNATYTESPGVSAVQRILEGQRGWEGGDTFEGELDNSLGTVRSVSMWAGFAVEKDGETTHYARKFLELTAPFEQAGPVPGKTEAAVTAKGGETVFSFTIAAGEQGVVRMTLPNHFAAGEAEVMEGDIPALELLRDGKTAAVLRLIPFATGDEETLRGLNHGANTLPMPVFAMVAAANHAGYEDYTVRKSTDTGACATAKYVWQDLTEYGGRAAEAPWQSVPCVLAYDTELAHFAEIVFREEIGADELRKLAESVLISK